MFVDKFPSEKARLQVYGHCIVYNSVYKLYQMFYLPSPNPTHWPNVRFGGVKRVGFVTRPAYAESTDGIHWERRLRKDVAFENNGGTNLLDLHVGHIFEAGVM